MNFTVFIQVLNSRLFQYFTAIIVTGHTEMVNIRLLMLIMISIILTSEVWNLVLKTPHSVWN